MKAMGLDAVYDSQEKNWVLDDHRGRKITVTAWKNSLKGPMVEIFIKEDERQIILEILMKEIDYEIYEPSSCNETAGRMLRLYKELEEEKDSEWTISDSVFAYYSKMRRWLLRMANAKAIHAYIDVGVSFGLKKTWRGIKEITVPMRCHEVPGSRF